MTEIERNKIVWNRLGMEMEPTDAVIENRFVDWDKAYTCIFYNDKSELMEKNGEDVYLNIRKANTDFLTAFKDKLIQLTNII